MATWLVELTIRNQPLKQMNLGKRHHRPEKFRYYLIVGRTGKQEVKANLILPGHLNLNTERKSFKLQVEVDPIESEISLSISIYVRHTI